MRLPTAFYEKLCVSAVNRNMKKVIVNIPVYNSQTNRSTYIKLVFSKQENNSNNVTFKDDFKFAVEDALSNARKFIQKKFGVMPLYEKINYYISHFAQVKKYLSGKSVGLGAYVGYISYILNLKIEDNYFFSAEVKSDKLKKVMNIKEKYDTIKNNFDNFKFFLSTENKTELKNVKNVKNVYFCKSVDEVIDKVFNKTEINKSIKKFKKYDIVQSLKIVEEQFQKHQYSIAENNYKNILYFLKSKKKQTNHTKENLLQVNTRLGIIYTHFGKLNELKEYFDEAQKLIDNDNENLLGGKYIVEYLNLKSVGLFDYYLFDEAYKTIKKGLKLADDYRISGREKGKLFGSRGHIYLQKKDYEKCELMYKKAIELVQNNEKSKDYIFLGNLYVRQNRINEAKTSLRKAKKYLGYIEDNEKKNIQMIYNKLLQLKIYDKAGISLKTANKVYNEIIILTDKIKQTAGLLYPRGVAGYYLAKIYFNKCEFNKAEEKVTDSYRYLESLDSPNIDVIAACIRLFKIAILLKKSDVIDKAEIMNQFETARKSIYKMPTIKKFFISKIKELETLLQKSSLNPKSIVNTITEIIALEPYI
jgi:tetratricopeptide (TPR) repeat protein